MAARRTSGTGVTDLWDWGYEEWPRGGPLGLGLRRSGRAADLWDWGYGVTADLWDWGYARRTSGTGVTRTADDLCGAKAGRALPFEARWHEAAAAALVPIPRVQPGDTVWWHNDVIHAVEPEHRGKSSSNVIYIGAAPWCPKNAAFLARQAQCFAEGKSCPDFAPEDYEVDFEGRATAEDLTPLGRQQMGLEPW